jgi:hypothetical protein
LLFGGDKRRVATSVEVVVAVSSVEIEEAISFGGLCYQLDWLPALSFSPSDKVFVIKIWTLVLQIIRISYNLFFPDT